MRGHRSKRAFLHMREDKNSVVPLSACREHCNSLLTTLMLLYSASENGHYYRHCPSHLILLPLLCVIHQRPLLVVFCTHSNTLDILTLLI